MNSKSDDDTVIPKKIMFDDYYDDYDDSVFNDDDDDDAVTPKRVLYDMYVDDEDDDYRPRKRLREFDPRETEKIEQNSTIDYLADLYKDMDTHIDPYPDEQYRIPNYEAMSDEELSNELYKRKIVPLEKFKSKRDAIRRLNVLNDFTSQRDTRPTYDSLILGLKNNEIERATEILDMMTINDLDNISDAARTNLINVLSSRINFKLRRLPSTGFETLLLYYGQPSMHKFVENYDSSWTSRNDELYFVANMFDVLHYDRTTTRYRVHTLMNLLKEGESAAQRAKLVVFYFSIYFPDAYLPLDLEPEEIEDYVANYSEDEYNTVMKQVKTIDELLYFTGFSSFGRKKAMKFM